MQDRLSGLERKIFSVIRFGDTEREKEPLVEGIKQSVQELILLQEEASHRTQKERGLPASGMGHATAQNEQWIVVRCQNICDGLYEGGATC